MSAVPRWSHRDPVEGGNPLSPGDARHRRWAEATAQARAALQRHDDDLARSALVTSDPRIYGRQLIELATARFDTWARRGLAAIDCDTRRRDYEAWLRGYLANWRAYVAETCPHVGAAERDELHAHLVTRATHWTTEALRAAGPTSERAVEPAGGDT